MQLLPTLIAIHEALEPLAGNHTTQAPISVPVPLVVELIFHEPVQVMMPTNADNLSVARILVVQPKEPAMYFTKTEIEAMFKKERERASSASTALI